MTRQSSTPLSPTTPQPSTRMAREIARSFRENAGIDVQPAYQRPSVWSDTDRIDLMESLMTGTPIGVIILNDRTADWYRPLADGEPFYAVIDGQQRLRTIFAWYDGELALPASWFPAEWVAHTEETDDGPYVRESGLTETGRRLLSNRFMIQISETRLPTLEAEAGLFRRVNTGGVPMTDADLDHAADTAAH